MSSMHSFTPNESVIIIPVCSERAKTTTFFVHNSQTTKGVFIRLVDFSVLKIVFIVPDLNLLYNGMVARIIGARPKSTYIVHLTLERSFTIETVRR